MTADEIREHCRVDMVEWARKRGAVKLGISADGILDTLRRRSNQIELTDVVAALADPAFEMLCHVQRVGTIESTSSGLTVLTYLLAKDV